MAAIVPLINELQRAIEGTLIACARDTPANGYVYPLASTSLATWGAYCAII